MTWALILTGAFALVEVAGGWQFRTRPDFQALLRQKLSDAVGAHADAENVAS